LFCSRDLGVCHMPRTAARASLALVALLACPVAARRFLADPFVRVRSLFGLAWGNQSNDGIYYYRYGRQISPWHDIPFEAGKDKNGTSLLSFVCEIPRISRSKNEIHKTVPFNPVLQDVEKDGSLRYYNYPLDKPGSICNYGAITQTWEDPKAPDPDTGLGGDNDPVDVLQLNMQPCTPGAVQRVKVLGALAMVDDSETDWKLLVIDVDAKDAPDWSDVGDVPTERVDELREWFRNYKTADGKPQNQFGLDERAVDAAHALRVARGTHEHWAAARQGQSKCTFKKTGCWLGSGYPKKGKDEV